MHPFLLSRLLLRFENPTENLLNEMSAIARTPDGSLWVGCDEGLSLERLSPLDDPYQYGNHRSYFLGDFIKLFNQEDEADIEGLDYSQPYLWFTGSHGKKRNKIKGKKTSKDIQRISEIKTDANRYLLGRIPLVKGELFQSCSHPTEAGLNLTAAALQKTEQGNCLIGALCDDPHLGSILSAQIPSKDNGLDIEGLAAHEDRVFLGLRGPVLNGWAIILELQVEETEPGTLTLKAIGENDQLYKKHFLDLQGLGIREICLDKEDLIILAGPTMALEGAMQVFRWKGALEHEDNTLSSRDSDDLEVLFDLPFTLGSDHAEGLTLMPCSGQDPALLIAYDSPSSNRLLRPDKILLDVFRLQ